MNQWAHSEQQPLRRTDFDGTGCTTREDILIRDLNPETISVDGDGRVEYGEATDPYTGHNMEHVLGDTDVDIEHVVAVGNAWRSGADDWEDETRREFYQDKDNLVAVSSAANQAKGDDDVAQPNGLPENQVLYCDLVGTQVFVKTSGVWPSTRTSTLKWSASSPPANARTPWRPRGSP